MALGNSTLQAAKQAAPFGLIGSGLGLALGMLVEARFAKCEHSCIEVSASEPLVWGYSMALTCPHR